MLGHTSVIHLKQIIYVKLFLFNNPYDKYIRNLRYKLFRHYTYKKYSERLKFKAIKKRALTIEICLHGIRKFLIKTKITFTY